MCRFVVASVVVGFCVLAWAQEIDKPAEPPADPATSQPAVKPASPRSPTQARILEELLRDAERARPTPILSDPERGSETIVEGGRGGVSLLPDGYPLSERAGRLVRKGGRLEFHFTSGSPVADAPEIMEFNKNRWLEVMEAEAEAGVEEFIISAEVTRYRGQNYLNLLKFRRQISHGNLSP
jgi:hypothetical protein